MSIIETGLQFGTLYPLDSVTHIVLHHAAGNGSAEEIHNYHKNHNGWAGIAYHLYVRKDGTIYRGRPIDKRGGHVAGHNRHTVGICFEGDFTKEQMSAEQIAAGREAVAYCKSVYPNAALVPHNYFGGTVCPGRNFPFAAITEPNAETEPEQTDKQTVPEWAKDALAWCMGRGITDGNRPNDTATRAEIWTMLWRALK